jgi:hypothetical protein
MQRNAKLCKLIRQFGFLVYPLGLLMYGQKTP